MAEPTTQQPPGTVVDLGKKVKAKYPQYAELSDLEVGRKVKAKHPEYSAFTDVEEAQPFPPAQSPSTTPDGAVGGRSLDGLSDASQPWSLVEDAPSPVATGGDIFNNAAVQKINEGFRGYDAEYPQPYSPKFTYQKPRIFKDGEGQQVQLPDGSLIDAREHRLQEDLKEHGGFISSQYTPEREAAMKSAGTWTGADELRKSQTPLVAQANTLRARKKGLDKAAEELGAARIEEEMLGLREQMDQMQRSGQVDPAQYNALVEAYNRDLQTLQPIIEEGRDIAAGFDYIRERHAQTEKAYAADPGTRDQSARQFGADRDFAEAEKEVRAGNYFSPAVIEQYILRPASSTVTKGLLNSAAALGRVLDIPNKALGIGGDYTALDEAADNLNATAEYLAPTPTQLTKPLFDEEWNMETRTILPKMMQAATYMTMMGTAGAARGTAGMVGAAYATSENDYYQEAIASGMKPQEAQAFSMRAAATTALLERINPGPLMGGRAVKDAMMDKVVRTLKEGRNWNEAIADGTKYVLKEGTMEGIQETSQTAGDKLNREITNIALGDEVLDSQGTAQEYAESALLGLAMGSLMAAGGKAAQRPAHLQTLDWAVRNRKKVEDFIRESKRPDAEDLIKDLRTRAAVYDGNDLEKLEPEKSAKVSSLIQQKKEVETTIKSAPMDPVLEAALGDPRKKKAAELTTQMIEAMGVAPDRARAALAGEGMVVPPEGSKLVTGPDGQVTLEEKPQEGKDKAPVAPTAEAEGVGPVSPEATIEALAAKPGEEWSEEEQAFYTENIEAVDAAINQKNEERVTTPTEATPTPPPEDTGAAPDIPDAVAPAPEPEPVDIPLPFETTTPKAKLEKMDPTARDLAERKDKLGQQKLVKNLTGVQKALDEAYYVGNNGQMLPRNPGGTSEEVANKILAKHNASVTIGPVSEDGSQRIQVTVKLPNKGSASFSASELPNILSEAKKLAKPISSEPIGGPKKRTMGNFDTVDAAKESLAMAEANLENAKGEKNKKLITLFQEQYDRVKKLHDQKVAAEEARVKYEKEQTPADFEAKSRYDREGRRLEAQQASHDFEERQKELAKSLSEDERVAGSMEDKVKFGEKLTEEERAYVNENFFRPEGYDFDENGGLVKTPEAQGEVVAPPAQAIAQQTSIDQAPAPAEAPLPKKKKKPTATKEPERVTTITEVARDNDTKPTQVEYKIPGWEDKKTVVRKTKGGWTGYIIDGDNDISIQPEGKEEPTAKLAAGDTAERLNRHGRAKVQGLIDKATQASLTDRAVKTAERLRASKRKLDPAALHDATEVLATAAYNGALEVAAQTIEKGGVVLDAINAAIKHLRASEFWKTADPAKKKEVLLRTKEAVQQSAPGAKSIKEQLQEAIKGAKAGERTKNREAREEFIATVKATMAGLSAKITPGQAKTIAREAARVNPRLSRSVGRFIRYAEKVIGDATYADKMTTARATAKRVGRKVKGDTAEKRVSAEQALAMRDFLGVDPSGVEDIDAYLDLATRALKTLEQVRVKNGEVSNESFAITNKELSDYTTKEKARQQEEANADMVQEFEDMKAAGLIPEGMTSEEFVAITQAINDEGHSKATEARADEKLQGMRSFLAWKQQLWNDKAAWDDSHTFTPQEQKAIDTIRGADLNKLDIVALTKVNTVMNNVMQNGDTSDLSRTAAIVEGIRNREAVIALGLKPTLDNFRAKIENFAGNVERLVGGVVKKAAALRHLSGIDNALNLGSQSIRRAGRFADDIIQKKKELGLRKQDTRANRTRMDVYNLSQQHYGGSAMEQQEAFAYHKSIVEDDIASLRAIPEKLRNKKEGHELNALQGAYDEILKDATSAEQAAEAMQRTNPKFKELTDWIVQRYSADLTKKVFDSARLDNNLNPEHVYNYAPFKWRRLRGIPTDQQSDDGLLPDRIIGKGVDNRPSGSKFSRTQRPKDSRKDYDFITNMVEGYAENDWDSSTAHARNVLAEFFRGPGLREQIGDESAALLRNNVIDMLAEQRGNNDTRNKDDRELMRAISAVRRVGQGVALKGILGPIKQSTVLMNTAVVLGTDFPSTFSFLDMENGDLLREQFQIGGRKSTSAGYEKMVQKLHHGHAKEDDMTTREEATNAVVKAAQAIVRGGDKLLEWTVTNPDVYAANMTWNAFYRQSLKQQGVNLDERDFSQEHRAPNQEAAAYANQMVERMQGANTAATMARMYRQGGGTKMVLGLLMPFSSFSLNMRLRIIRDFKTLRTGATEDRAQAAQSLSGTLLEQALFNTVKTVFWIAVVQKVQELVLESLGMGDDDEEKERKAASQTPWRDLVATTLSDFLVGGTPQPIQSAAQDGANWAWRFAKPSSDTKDLFFRYPDEEGQWGWVRYAGEFGVGARVANRILLKGGALMEGDYYVAEGNYKNYGDRSMAEWYRIGSAGGLKEGDPVVLKTEGTGRELTPEQEGIIALSMMIDAASLVGYSEQTVNGINNKVWRKMQKELMQQKGDKETLSRFKPAR